MKKMIYKPNVISFDIESTSITTYKDKTHRDGSVTKEVDEKLAFMYVGAIYNNGVIFIYRTWKEIIKYFDSLSRLCGDNERYVIWVHNLSFEFQFMKDWMKLEEVFCRKSHNVLRCVYKNIEFRDTLALSNCKLATLAENEKLSVKKLEGDLDYSMIRHWKTPLTEKEIQYVKHDVIIVAEYVKKKIKEYGSIGEIPMTSTGEVRYLFRKELGQKLKKIHSLAVQYSARTIELQNLLIRTYAGAYTHGNYQCIDQIRYDIDCYDISSSYPFQMVARKFPTIWFKLKEDVYNLKTFLKKYNCNDFAFVAEAEFSQLNAKHCHAIISQHKCEKLSDDCVIDNGRVAFASYCKIPVTEIDLLNILDFYDVDDIYLSNIHVSKKEYLPKELVSIILKLFKAKTELKDIESEIENYMRSKGRINGVYGSSVFNVLDSGYYFDEESNCKFLKEEKNFSDFKKYTANPNQYLWYAIGVWVTVYAKRQILEPIKKMSENCLYSDTDSVKCQKGRRYKKLFSRLNSKVKTEFMEAMKYHNFTPEEYTFKDKNGKQHYLGVFEKEPSYKRFKCLGSKRYLVEFYDGTMKSTVAGAPKDLYKHLGKTNDEKFKNFKHNFVLPNCKLTHTYTEGRKLKIIKDYLGESIVVDVRSGVCLTPADFSMKLSDQFFDFLLGRIHFEDKDIYRYFQYRQFKK